MRIETVDFFYLAMPEVQNIGDGSQDVLLVRVRAGAFEGWGECEASPLTSIAAAVCPMSHSACKPVLASVIGQRLEDVADIRRINREVRENSFDLLQADHTLSGIDTALWDLLGKKLEEPVYRLLGDNQSFPKTPYASQLFGDTPEETYARARKAADAGYRAAKFGWGPYGKCTLEQDIEQVRAARRGLGPDGTLLVDAGTAWGDDVAQAGKRIASLRECRVLWLEEPFVNGALGAYRALSDIAVAAPTVRLAGGEGCSNYHSAQQLIDFAGIGFIQIDTGRIGGITTARDVAQYAYERGVTFVNHTFTTQLALSASIQPYAGYEDAVLCEYPFEPSPLAVELTAGRTLLDAQGLVCLPEAPGLGLEPAPAAIRKYLVDVEIRVGAKVLYRTPEVVS